MNLELIKTTLQKQATHIERVHQNEGHSKISLWLNAVKCCLLYRATPTDWMNFRMWEKSHRALRRFITHPRCVALDHMFNPREYKDIFTDKARFNEEFSEFIHRKWIYTKEHNREEIKRFVEEIGRVILKPIGLSSGRGIRQINVTEKNIDELLDQVVDADYLLEERAINVETLQKLNPPSCQTLRVYTIIAGDEIRFVGAAMRVGGGNSIVDNFHANGVAYPVDIQTGIISGTGIDGEGNRYLKHPSTGIIMPGLQIPQWDEVLDFCRRAALKHPRARFIGWDVTLTPNGCEMIEGNVNPNCNLLQIYIQRGRWKELKNLL